MVATISTRTHTATHGSLRRSISDYTAGQLSKQDISQLLAKAVEIDPDCGPAIKEFLAREKHGRRLSSKDHEELTAGLLISPSENIPTETSEGVPDKSGLYRVDDEGTLILSGDFEAVPPPPLADDVPLRKKPQTQGDDKKEPQGLAKSPAGLEVGSILRERFRLDEEVASGSMGLVYRATDLLKLEAGAISPAVAIKVINPSFANNSAALKTFQNEVANTQHLSHPNIIHLFELDKHGEHFFITMEWLEGESLDMLLDRSMGSALPPIQAYAIIEQLCDALAYAHARNVVHADIKPGNVFLTKPGELKLIDLGIAHISDAKKSANNLDEDPQALGLTPAYASCEALEREKPTSQDDLFSLACLVYRLLSGRRAFGSLTALQAESEGVELVPIGGMSESRWEALEKALSFRRCDRQPDVTTFAKEFGQRTAPRQYEIQPEVEDVAFTETMTLQALPEGLDVPEVLTEDQSDNEPETEINDSVSVNTTALDSSQERVEIIPAATEPDDILIVDTAEVDLLPDIDASGENWPEAEPDDLVFTETQSLGIPPENLEATASDTVNLDETAPLGAASFEPEIDLLGTHLPGTAPDTSPVNAASTDTEDLSEMPEPINFFDSDCDDSVFVPLDGSAIQAAEQNTCVDADEVEVLPVAEQNTCVDTEEVEVLPADSFVAGDAVEATVAV
ncbi:MAG: protein kinase, partial [Xanthomonadales bacterium]|nr:protein kinase [Xanthomonadales bacterium]